MKVWVLTREINQYEQEGPYFVGVFREKPSPQQLVDVGVPEHSINHVLEGGGRIKDEYEWWNLAQEEAK